MGNSNGYNFAGGQSQCPRCGYKSDDADFAVSGGSSGTSDPSSPGALRTQDRAPTGSGGTPLTVRGASSDNLGLANNGGRDIRLARRIPVRTPQDLLPSRQEDGTAIFRHRQGGGTVGQLKRNSDGTYTTVVNGRTLSPHAVQQGAVREMIGVYNAGASSLDRPPLQPPPEQTPLMSQFGIPAVRALATPTGGASDGPRTTGSDSSGDTDDDNTSDGGLTPRGQQIYKKLTGKGIAPKVAMAMAKRAQNGPPGRRS